MLANGNYHRFGLFSLAGSLLCAALVVFAFTDAAQASQPGDVSGDSSRALIKDWQSSVHGETLRVARGFGDCVRKPTFNNPCGACSGFGVFEQVGPDCPGCGLFCTRIPFSQGSELGNVAGDRPIPPYAVVVEEIDPISCVDGAPLSEGEIRAAIWNPSDALAALDPFALEVDRESFMELAIAHPAAAYAVSQRMLANGQVVVGPDMHFRESRGLNSRVTSEYMLAWMDDPEAADTSSWKELVGGESFRYRYGTEFGEAGAWRLIVESWIEADDAPQRIGYKKSEIAVEPHPVGRAPVQASNDFEAPVYAVTGFQVNSDLDH